MRLMLELKLSNGASELGLQNSHILNQFVIYHEETNKMINSGFLRGRRRVKLCTVSFWTTDKVDETT